MFNTYKNTHWGDGPRLLSRHSDSLRAGRFGDRIPVKGEIFRTGPDRPWGPRILLYKGYWVFPGGKAAGAWRWPPTPSSAEVKERVRLYLYSPSRAFVACSRVSFTFTFTHRDPSSDTNAGWTIRHSNLCKKNKFFSFPKRPDRPCGTLPILWVVKLVPGVKPSIREFDHTRQSSS